MPEIATPPPEIHALSTQVESLMSELRTAQAQLQERGILAAAPQIGHAPAALAHERFASPQTLQEETTMSNSQFFFAISLIVALMIVPLIVAVAVRFLVKDEPPEEEVAQIEPQLQFNNLKDFWESNVPHLIELRNG